MIEIGTRVRINKELTYTKKSNILTPIMMQFAGQLGTVSGNGRYNGFDYVQINGYCWHEQDVTRLNGKKVKVKPELFNENNLVT